VKIDEQVYFYNPNLSAAKRFFTTKTRRLKEEQKLVVIPPVHQTVRKRCVCLQDSKTLS